MTPLPLQFEYLLAARSEALQVRRLVQQRELRGGIKAVVMSPVRKSTFIIRYLVRKDLLSTAAMPRDVGMTRLLARGTCKIHGVLFKSYCVSDYR